MWKVLNSTPRENTDNCRTFNPLKLLNSSVHVNAVVWQLVTLFEETRHSNTPLHSIYHKLPAAPPRSVLSAVL